MSITQTIPTTQVRRAAPGELPALARALTSAFADDPVTAWILPDEADRVERLGRFFGEIFLPRMALGRDELYTDDEVRGVASWTPPGQGETGLIDMLGLLPRMAALWGRWLPRALKTLSYMESQFPELEFPRFCGHLMAGPSGPAGRISVHAVDPAVSGAVQARCRRVGAFVGEVDPADRRRAGSLAAVAAQLGQAVSA
jgi:hypothetical protein